MSPVQLGRALLHGSAWYLCFCDTHPHTHIHILYIIHIYIYIYRYTMVYVWITYVYPPLLLHISPYWCTLFPRSTSPCQHPSVFLWGAGSARPATAIIAAFQAQNVTAGDTLVICDVGRLKSPQKGSNFKGPIFFSLSLSLSVNASVSTAKPWPKTRF